MEKMEKMVLLAKNSAVYARRHFIGQAFWPLWIVIIVEMHLIHFKSSSFVDSY